jgi:hypothetical protein
MQKPSVPPLRPRLALLSLLLAATGGIAAAQPAPAPLPEQLRWVPADLGGGRVTLDGASRILLARSAAESAGLHEVGLDFRDLYGVISAETSWVPRTGKGRNGVASEGLAQFEPATARAVGLRDPNNPVEAVQAAARLLREAAVWSKQRIARLALGPEQRAAKLREGISVYYNLSSQARSAWSGLNTSELPFETLRHIRNVRDGARQADQLNAKLGGSSLPPLPAQDAARLAASERVVDGRHSEPKAMGTIEWSGQGGEGPHAGRRSYVVLSSGAVRPQGNGEVPAGAIRFTPRGRAG